MPELPEVERYRQLAERTLGRSIVEVIATDDWYLKRDTTAEALSEALMGRSFERTRRVGKLLLLDVADSTAVVGLHFGMSGTLLVDEERGVEQLIYSSHRVLPKWDRFTVRFHDGGEMRINDARRLGGVELDPDESRLGVDALSLTLGSLRAQLEKSTAPLKARLMDQSRVAGVGNLIADEALWRAGLDPARAANSLNDTELKKLQRHLKKTIEDLILRGGSHHGDIMVARFPGGSCPKDGATFVRRTVGGRTTFSCPKHQI